MCRELHDSRFCYDHACSRWSCRVVDSERRSDFLQSRCSFSTLLHQGDFPSFTSFLITAVDGLNGVAFKALLENRVRPRGLGSNIKVFLHAVPSSSCSPRKMRRYNRAAFQEAARSLHVLGKLEKNCLRGSLRDA